MSLIKKFSEWFSLKERLHGKNHVAPLVSMRDVWWVNFGENVGSEMDGKGPKFSRPALVLKKLSHGFYLVAPTTTKPHEGTWYAHVQLQGVDEYVCLHQIRTIDYRRLDKKLGQLDTDDFARVKNKFSDLYIK